MAETGQVRRSWVRTRSSALPPQAAHPPLQINHLLSATSGHHDGLTSSINIALTRTSDKRGCGGFGAGAPGLLAGCADTGYLSSQTSSMRQPLVMLLTMIVNPFT